MTSWKLKCGNTEIRMRINQSIFNQYVRVSVFSRVVRNQINWRQTRVQFHVSVNKIKTRKSEVCWCDELQETTEKVIEAEKAVNQTKWCRTSCFQISFRSKPDESCFYLIVCVDLNLSGGSRTSCLMCFMIWSHLHEEKLGYFV